MEADTVPHPVAKVTGLYLGTFAQMGRAQDFSLETRGTQARSSRSGLRMNRMGDIQITGDMNA
ncbi:MAG: hypothetical protein WC015_06540 [Methanoregula sp.]